MDDFLLYRCKTCPNTITCNVSGMEYECRDCGTTMYEDGDWVRAETVEPTLQERKIVQFTREKDDLQKQVALLRSVLIDARGALRAINTSGAILQIDAVLNTEKETG